MSARSYACRPCVPMRHASKTRPWQAAVGLRCASCPPDGPVRCQMRCSARLVADRSSHALLGPRLLHPRAARERDMFCDEMRFALREVSRVKQPKTRRVTCLARSLVEGGVPWRLACRRTRRGAPICTRGEDFRACGTRHDGNSTFFWIVPAHAHETSRACRAAHSERAIFNLHASDLSRRAQPTR